MAPKTVVETVLLTLGNRDLGSCQKLVSCASREFLMIQATPAEFGWMARHCDVSMPVKLSEENSMLSLWFLFLKVKTLFGYLSVLLVCIDSCRSSDMFHHLHLVFGFVLVQMSLLLVLLAPGANRAL